MIKDKINITFVDLSHEAITLSCSFKKHIYLEQLLFDILEHLGVGPICRTLFGFRLRKSKPIWLAPNTKLSKLHLIMSTCSEIKNPDNYSIDLRIRFIPSSITKLQVLDKVAFELLFAQIRYDLLHSNFKDEERTSILMDDNLMGLIATDVLRISIEKNTNTSDIYKTMKHRDFVPHKAPTLFKSAVFPLRKRFHLEKSLENINNNSHKKSEVLKQSYIEHFIRVVCPDYGSETYKILGLHLPANPQQLFLRVRYQQTKEDSSCILEARGLKRSSSWVFLCNLETLCYANIQYNIVELNVFCEKPYKISFESLLHAHSFLSIIDGYYRLMKKWHATNFCKEVSSPDLIYLDSIRCHGPIGFESVRDKIPASKRPGTYMIRRSMNKCNEYIIDVLLEPKMFLQIYFTLDQKSGICKIIRCASSKSPDIKLRESFTEYKDLKELTDDVHVMISENFDIKYSPLHLRTLIEPSEYDDYPLLLLSKSKKAFKEMLDKKNSRNNIQSLKGLPNLIPPTLIEIEAKSEALISRNGMIVKFAKLESDRKVIVKELLENPLSTTSDLTRVSLNILRKRIKNQEQEENDQLEPIKNRLIDWVVLQNSMFAETFGILIDKGALVQEYLTNRLDEYLKKVKNIPERMLRLITCQLSHALIFLQEKQIIHGKLRCHNIFLKSMNPIQIKITDMLGFMDSTIDKAFLAPEYYRSDNKIILSQYEIGLDVWAFATTVWQIYSLGKYPPSQYANTLMRPDLCSESVWRVLEECWIVAPQRRATPQTIYRGLNEGLDSESMHDYNYIVCSESDENIFNRHNFFWQDQETNTTTVSIKSDNFDELSTSNKEEENDDPNSKRKRYLEAISSGGNLLYSNLKKKYKKIVLKENSISKINELFDDDSTVSESTANNNFQNSNELELMRSNLVSDNEVEDWEIDPKHLQLSVVRLGEGATGRVMKATLYNWANVEEQLVAVKTVCKESDYLTKVEDLKREFRILKNLDHENIVRTLGYVRGPNLQIVIEFVAIGSLLEFLKDKDHHSLPLRKYSLDVAKGMEYLEEKRIVHRDLALRNVLVDGPERVKICDFGLAQTLMDFEYYKLQTHDRALPVYWLAPESLIDWKFSHKTDVWSYGIFIWELYSGGDNPLKICNVDNLASEGSQQRFKTPKDCPKYMEQLMQHCWVYNPKNRFNFKQIREYIENHH